MSGIASSAGSHNHTFAMDSNLTAYTRTGVSYDDQSGAGTGGAKEYYTSSNGSHIHSCDVSGANHTHSASSDYSGGNESRPYNYTIQIWKRIN